MKFKVGDKVKHKKFGIGEIIGFDVHDASYAVEYAVEFEHEHYMLHNFSEDYMNAGLSNPIDRKAGCWCWDDEIELVFELITEKKKIKKLSQKPVLTEDEKVILRNLPKEYKWIARESCGELYVYENKPVKMRYEWNRGVAGSSYNNLNSFQHLFQFIKWEDEEPYNVEELLKE